MPIVKKPISQLRDASRVGKTYFTRRKVKVTFARDICNVVHFHNELVWNYVTRWTSILDTRSRKGSRPDADRTEETGKGEEAQRRRDLHLVCEDEGLSKRKSLTTELYIGLEGSHKYRTALKSDDKKKQEPTKRVPRP